MNVSLKSEYPVSARRAPTAHRKICFWALVLAGLSVIGLYYHSAPLFNLYHLDVLSTKPVKGGCPFPLPNHLLKQQPLQHGEGPLTKSSKKLHAYLSERTSHSDIDSLSIAIVTPSGTVFEHSYGVLKANETVSERPISSNSIYRIASITKMFTMLETLILRERGVLDLDDPVEKFLPEIKYPSYGWSEYLRGGDADYSGGVRPRITLRQLASHMSGMGRDYPPSDIGDWPQNSPIPSFKRMRTQDDLPFPKRNYEQLVKSVNKYPLVNLPYDYPIYSNSGIDLLGLSNVAANKRASSQPNDEPQSHEDLINRDIFGPLGLNSSFYHVPYGTPLVDDLAVPNKDHDWADFYFDPADVPAGAQYSSLADLVTVMQSFLDPAENDGLVSEHVIREWLHPLFTWKNGFQEVGAPWEITTINDNVRLYMKGGNIPGYHSEFALVPEFQYGIIVLLTGTYTNTAEIVHRAASLFQPAIHKLLEERVTKAYTGHWAGASTEDHKGRTTAEIKLINGGLYLTELVVRGYDVLRIVEDADVSLHKPYPIALWNTGRPGEFRLAFGRKALNDDPTAGCMPYWVSIDNPMFSRGAPIDLIYWDGDQLVYPSGGARLERV
ncbi:beta-lactamase/transpeptidase-like protein [Macrolepiota fuliginosa MF-IS2]|uniref:Beta-lactamase/transpeptidase-like protein n=1 Tax=Macrolepiota fuliginosa MF-IS2 TaxID=1400762 RepID=A0A9P5XP09_9AGAR|nr:beta-lactamase/transpeptidase-like protein [Macrolepiota fuliginosa MF-IS2]